MNKVTDIGKAELKTLTVTIKALTIENKRMPLAVFRQIPERGWNNIGIPFGFVRYSIGERNYWLVYSDEGVLRKRSVCLRGPGNGVLVGYEAAINEAEKKLKEFGDGSDCMVFQKDEVMRASRIKQTLRTLEAEVLQCKNALQKEIEDFNAHRAAYLHDKNLIETLPQLYIGA